MDFPGLDGLGVNIIFKTSLFVLTLCSLIALILFPAYSEQPVNFPDEHLDQEIRDVIDKQSGKIYPSDLEGLNLGWNDISDIVPLSNLTNVQVLSLPRNSISNLSPLSDLTNLKRLSLSNNNISNIQPLVDNSDLDDGDKIDPK